MFKINTMVAWATRDNTFTGRVLESNEIQSVVIVTNSAKRSALVNKKLVIKNENLGDFSSGKTEVLQSEGITL